MSHKEMQVVGFECAGEIPPHYTGWCFIEDCSERFYLKHGFVDTDEENPDEPSVIDEYGMWWCREGRNHRIGGPAVFFRGDIHETDGSYFLDGVGYTEEEYWSHPLMVEYKLKGILELK